MSVTKYPLATQHLVYLNNVFAEFSAETAALSAVEQSLSEGNMTVYKKVEWFILSKDVSVPTPEPIPEPVPEPVPEPTPVPSGNLVFLDDFQYTVRRDDVAAESIFQQHGWSQVKTQQSTTRNARGYIYTVDSIPGYSGPEPFPGKALCIEALPASMGGQTDFYLEYDQGLPANVWFRFWMFINHTPEQPSRMDENKFIYACNGEYPCHDYRWMFSLATGSADPLWQSVDGSQGDCFLNLSANPTYSADRVSNNQTTNPEYEWRMGQNNLAERIRPNRWQEVTLHMDTSGRGIYEAWIQPLGGTKVKVAEYISGQNGFDWSIPVPSGHRVFRMPTTVGRANGFGYDQWLYMKNFRIASSEVAL